MLQTITEVKRANDVLIQELIRIGVLIVKEDGTLTTI